MVQSKTSLLSSGKKADRQAKERDVLAKYNYSNGFGWRSVKNRKKNNRFKGQTPGRSKGALCQANAKQRHFAKCSRSYKHPEYDTWVRTTRLWK